jgi:hypothetical protein
MGMLFCQPVSKNKYKKFSNVIREIRMAFFNAVA